MLYPHQEPRHVSATEQSAPRLDLEKCRLVPCVTMREQNKVIAFVQRTTRILLLEQVNPTVPEDFQHIPSNAPAREKLNFRT